MEWWQKLWHDIKKREAYERQQKQHFKKLKEKEQQRKINDYSN